MRLSECYALLEVPPEATLEEIKVSYRKLAFKYHPDLNPKQGDEVRNDHDPVDLRRWIWKK